MMSLTLKFVVIALKLGVVLTTRGQFNPFIMAIFVN